MSSALRRHWSLDPNVTFLNHGSFGACPPRVVEVAAHYRTLLEREPVQFFERLLEPALEAARAEVSQFIGARAEDFAFVQNATAGVNAVLRSLELRSGDVILKTNHTYGACSNTLEYVARRAGVEVVTVNIPLPIEEPGEVVERVLSAVTSRVKLALVDHVTSATGLVFPIADIVRELATHGVQTLVDGAHAAGMVALDVNAIGAAYYAGNLHKWVCAPKGAGFLVVREDMQAGIHPNVISHGLTSTRARRRFLEEFDWTGTADPGAWLAVPEAIRFVGELVPGGWASVRAHNRALVLEARELLASALGATNIAPESMIGSLAAVTLPDAEGEALATHADDPLHRALYERHGIEVPVVPWPAHPKRLLRVSAHVYNVLADYERLVEALKLEGVTR